jgi:hypothetical protein
LEIMVIPLLWPIVMRSNLPNLAVITRPLRIADMV